MKSKEVCMEANEQNVVYFTLSLRLGPIEQWQRGEKEKSALWSFFQTQRAGEEDAVVAALCNTAT